VSLGFLPLGTGNSFLRDFTDSGHQAAAEALMQGKRRPCDVIRLIHAQGEIFYINLLSLGFPADVCALTNRRLKGFGTAGYGIGVVSTVVNLKARAFPLSTNSGIRWDMPTTLISFCNSRFTGGTMMMAPRAIPSDGEVDMVAMGQMGRLELLRTFPQIFAGTHVHHPKAVTARASQVTLEIESDIDAMVDGEVIRCTPRRLEVMPSVFDVRI
jgi:diacylglycerol kinase family enzyme